jgi:hypothetical protein
LVPVAPAIAATDEPSCLRTSSIPDADRHPGGCPTNSDLLLVEQRCLQTSGQRRRPAAADYCVSALGTRGHPGRRPVAVLIDSRSLSKNLLVAHNGTVVRIRGSSAKAPRQHGVGFPADRDDGHLDGRGMTSVARGSVAVVEVGRPATFSPMGLVFLRAWSYLRFVIQQARNPRWAAASSGAHASNVPAVRFHRQKLWPRCSSPGCDRPVPPDAVHDLCGRAGPYVALIRSPRHGGPCCPGTCPGCRACLDTPRVQAGWCVRCGVCVVCCRGHDVSAWPTVRDSGRVRGKLQPPANSRRHGHRQAKGKLSGKQPTLPAQRSASSSAATPQTRYP